MIVTDQSAAVFLALPAKTRVATLRDETPGGDYPYKQIYLSRLVKMQAPLQARTDCILMIDSDLNLLSMPQIALQDDHIYASFRQGKMIDKLSGLALAAMLDIRSINLGEWMNWPAAKRIGGTPSVIPPQVVGAHGGFPLSEWHKYLHSHDTPLLFKPQTYMEKYTISVIKSGLRASGGSAFAVNREDIKPGEEML